MLQILPVQSRRDQKAFIHLPWVIYKDDPYWVPPLISEMKTWFKRNHPFYEYGEMQFFIAKMNTQVVGRIAAINNPLYEQHHGINMGFFGFFESINDQNVANALLEAAEKWLNHRGITQIQGPANPSSNYEIGLLIEGFEDSPRIMMTYNPPYYEQLILNFGFKKVKNLLAYKVDAAEALKNKKLQRVVGLAKKRYGLTVRNFDLKNLKQEVMHLKKVYNAAWEPNWGHVPFTDKEIDAMAAGLKPIAESKLLVFGEIDGEVVAIGLALLDYNFILKQMNGRLFPFNFIKMFTQKKHIKWSRVLTLGVEPKHQKKGIDGILCYELLKAAVEMGVPYGEGSWVLEDNEMMKRSMQNFNGVVYKKYGMYEKQ